MRKGFAMTVLAASLGLAACQHPDGSLDVGNTLLLGAGVAAVAGVAASQPSYQPVGWGYGHRGYGYRHHGWHRPHHWHQPHHGWHRPHHWHRPQHWHGGGWHHGWRQHHHHWRGW